MDKDFRHKRRPSVAAPSYNPEADVDENAFTFKAHAKTEEQKKMLRECIKEIILFRCIEDNETLNKIISSMQRKKCKKGDVIIREGDEDNEFLYVIETGSFDASCNKIVVKSYINEGYFGELSLMYSTPRAATVTSVSDNSVLWLLPSEVFQKLVLNRACKMRNIYVNLISKVSIFEELNGYEKMNLCDAFVTKHYLKNDVIFRENEKGTEMFFIQEGKVSIRCQESSGEVELAELGTGKYFGELSLVLNKPRAASAYAKTDVTLAVISVRCFERLLGPCKEIMKRNTDKYRRRKDDILKKNVHIT